MSDIKGFYNRIGLVEYPFTSYTTEKENKRFTDLFVEPNEYNLTAEQFNEKTSIILAGDRGTGKTAILKNLIDKLDEKENIKSVITDFTQLKTNYSQTDLYQFIIKNFSVSLFESLSLKPSRISRLDKEEKILLSYLLKNFVPQISKTTLKEKIRKIQLPWYKRYYKKVEGFVRGIFNYGATVGGAFVDDYIAKHFTGLPPLTDSVKIKDYFPELPENIENEFIDQEISIQLLQRVVSISKKLGFEKLLIAIDKIDEDPRFGSDADKISEFILPLLQDNQLLLTENIQFLICVWATPFSFIKSQVRTQKHFCTVLTWRVEDMERALNRRLATYSNGKVTDYNQLFDESVTKAQKDFVFEIANNNPRDLWHIYNWLFKTQFRLDPNSVRITSAAFSPAIHDFVKNFEYYEYYPRKSNASANSMDIYSYVRHLLKLDKPIFTKNQYSEKTGIGGGSTTNYVTGMERIGLIERHSQESGAVHYKVKDPKIAYAIENKVEIKNE